MFLTKSISQKLIKKKKNSLPWASRSPGLIVENRWVTLYLKVNDNNKQFSSANELQVAFGIECHNISK